MTACTNHGGKARRVVTAALVGVLSVGTVPMVALATSTEADGIETLAAEWWTDVKVTAAQDGQNHNLTGDLMKQTFSLSSGKYLLPTEIENSAGYKTEVDLAKYNIAYYGPSGTQVAYISSEKDTATPYFDGNTTAGTYSVSIIDKATREPTNRISFVISAGSVWDGAYAYVGSDPANKDIVFNGADDTEMKAALKFADADGNEIKNEDATAYSITTIKSAETGSSMTGVLPAGNYVANLSNGSNVSFTIQKLDLSSATVTLPDVLKTSAEFSSYVTDRDNILGDVLINDATLKDESVIKITGLVNPKGSVWVNSGETGKYTVTIASNNSSVTGEATFEFYCLDSDIVTGNVHYGRPSAGSTIEVYLVDGESFDVSKVNVVNGADKYDADDLEITFTQDGKPVDASALADAGTYKMTVRMKAFQPFGTTSWVGGFDQIDVKVYGANVDANKNLAFYFDGELAGDDKQVTYDGTDQLGRVTAVLKDSDGNTLVEGTDYELVATDENGDEVAEAVDAGTYFVTVKPLTFEFPVGTNDEDYTFQLDIEPVALTRLVADVDDMKISANSMTGYIMDSANGNEFYVVYTGSAVEVPAVAYQTGNATDGFEYVTLDPSLYEVVSIKDADGKTVEGAVEAGDYTVKIALTDAAAQNYTLANSASTFEFTVKEYGKFSDVKADAWYAEVVEKAYKNWYVNGIADTNLFAPESEITRADVACILYNMAGGDQISQDDDFSFSEDGGYITGFDDVDGHAYYAKAIAWAHASGVVNGDGGNFRPTDKITREEFASMLANFAKSKGDFVAASEGALDGVSDASTVSGWAEANVAWAVENGIMGNGGYVKATDNILRAEVAAMAVNYQPEMLVGTPRP